MFDVQFHTPASFEATMSTRELCERLRLPGVDAGEQGRLAEAQAEVFAGVARAPGAADLRIEEILP